ncbi:YrdB family protein [Herbiconiux sp. KACC 21604]|uniref:YrdB family protein n=1 Tax=unclassified Herbiconiux TaxID=2618217 RepID=UPI0020A5CF0A|nr:YrdB family protein [Herbiconiux sp. SALV-R1]WPO87348.1 YrdB family protein [Herbiconiux sp. KACC 21604]
MQDDSPAPGAPGPSGAPRAPRDVKVGVNDVVRFVLELFAFFTFGFWGFVAWPLPWNIVLGIVTPLFAVLIWALFLSPRAVIRLDAFGRALVEIVVMGGAALAWLMLEQSLIALVFGVVAVVSGVIAGRKEFS